MDKITICYAPDENYAGITAVSMTSVLKNSKDEFIEFVILHSELSETTINKLNQVKTIKDCEIKYIKIDRNEFSQLPLANWVTTAAWFRMKIAELCPNNDKAIYLDSDTMILCSLSNLWNTDLKENYVGAVCGKTTRTNLKDKLYFNSGVLLINCRKWREDNVFNKIINFASTAKGKTKYADQDVLNIICDGKKFNLDAEYNYCEDFKNPDKKIMQAPKIVHFVGPNPNRYDCLHSQKINWLKYAKLTAFYDEFINQNIYNIVKMYPKLKFDEIKFSLLAKICIGKKKERYIKKHILHSRLINSLRY